MPSDTIRLYQSTSSPNSRRVRIFLAEKGLSIPLVAVDLGKGDQHSEAYHAINPRRGVPTLGLRDSTTIAQAPAMSRYIAQIHPAPPSLVVTATGKANGPVCETRA